jgi:hypothetical protein
MHEAKKLTGLLTPRIGHLEMKIPICQKRRLGEMEMAVGRISTFWPVSIQGPDTIEYIRYKHVFANAI